MFLVPVCTPLLFPFLPSPPSPSPSASLLPLNLRLYLLTALVFLIHDPFWDGTRFVVGVGSRRWLAFSVLFGNDGGICVPGLVLVGAEDDTGFGGDYYWVVY